jgi:membrane protein implicated in regulation of membrane protease activity
MLRTILMTGVLVMLGMFALGFVFSIFGGLIGLTFLLLGFAIKALIVGAVAYLAIRIISPDTARKLRDRWSGTSIDRY